MIRTRRPHGQGFRFASHPGLVLGLLALGACAATPSDRSTPQRAAQAPPLVVERFEDLDLAAATPDVPIGRWWTTFGDPVLDRAVDEALASNRSIRIAAANLRAARALSDAAQLARRPAGGVSGSIEQGRPAVPGLGRQPDQTVADLGLGAAWEVDLWGRIDALQAGALADADAADALRRGVVLAIVADTVRAYADIRSAQSRLVRARQTADVQDELASLVARAQAAGRGIPADVSAARAQARTTRSLIPALELELATARRQLAILQGGVADSGPDLPPGAPLAAPLRVAVGSPGEALSRRPDVAAAEARLRRADSDVALAVAALRPSISFSISGGGTADLGDFVSGGVLRFGIGPSITWPLFEQDRLQLRTKAAQAGAEAAYLAWEDTAVRGLREANDALTALGRERERLALLIEAESDTAEAAATARLRYRAGLVPLRDVLDADSRALAAEAATASAASAATAAYIALNQALGLSI